VNYIELQPPRISEVAQTLIRKTLWPRLPKKSIVSGLWLRNYEQTPLFNNCFLHVLPPSKFPYFKYYMKNIVLVTPGEKGLWEQGSEEERIHYSLDVEKQSKGKSTAKWDVLKTLETKLEAEYKKAFPSTVGMLIDYKYSLMEQQEILGKMNQEYFDNLK